jgi:hypothetical protein
MPKYSSILSRYAWFFFWDSELIDFLGIYVTKAKNYIDILILVYLRRERLFYFSTSVRATINQN